MLRQQHDASTPLSSETRSSRTPATSRINDAATKSTCCWIPNSRSCLSCSVMAGSGIGGTRNVDGLALAKRACVAHGAVDVGAFDGVDRKLDHAVVHKDGSTGLKRAGKPDNSATRCCFVPSTSTSVNVKRCPAASCTGWCRQAGRANLRAFRVKQDSARTGHLGAHAAQRSIRRACSSCVPWLKLKRAMSMPAAIVARSFDSSSTAGRSVQTIFRSFCHGFPLALSRHFVSAHRLYRKTSLPPMWRQARLIALHVRGNAHAAARFQRPTGRAGCSTRRRAPACRLRQRRTWPPGASEA